MRRDTYSFHTKTADHPCILVGSGSWPDGCPPCTVRSGHSCTGHGTAHSGMTGGTGTRRCWCTLAWCNRPKDCPDIHPCSGSGHCDCSPTCSTHCGRTVCDGTDRYSSCSRTPPLLDSRYRCGIRSRSRLAAHCPCTLRGKRKSHDGTARDTRRSGCKVLC